jgi:hypothetical protein
VEIEQILSKRLKSKQMVGFAVTDGAAVEIKTCKLLEIDDCYCADHRLHLIVTHAT